MTKLLEEAIARIETLPEDEQDRAAQALIAIAADTRPYTLTAEQIAGVRHAQDQADHGQLATDAEITAIFSRAL